MCQFGEPSKESTGVGFSFGSVSKPSAAPGGFSFGQAAGQPPAAAAPSAASEQVHISFLPLPIFNVFFYLITGTVIGSVVDPDLYFIDPSDP